MPVPTVSRSKTVEGKPKAAQKPKTQERPILYPDYEVKICCLPRNGKTYDGAVQVEQAMLLLGWETEDDYVRRMLGENPDLKENKLRFGNEYLLKNKDGVKVRCWNNSTNRPFDEGHSRKIAQDILTKNWEFNLEDIIVSLTGIVLSGQHRLVALVLAWEEWQKQVHWQEVWAEAPYIESLVAFGASEDPKVLRTLDNVKPRSLSDVFYTSPLFANKNQADKKECSRMLDYAVDLLWKRTNATAGGFIEYQTHSASLDFFDRHKKLQACVKHIHDEDGGGDGRAISNLGLNTGHASALLYLMGQSRTDGDRADAYRSPESPKTEKQLDWKDWDKALEFWSEVAKNPEAKNSVDRPAPWVQTLKDALAGLNDKDTTRGSTTREQHAVLALAWAMIREKNTDFKQVDITPDFVTDPNTNKRKITDEPTFGGIDLGSAGEKDEVGEIDPTPEELEVAKEVERKARADKRDAQAKSKTLVPPPTVEPKTTITADATKKVLPVPTPKANGTLNAVPKAKAPQKPKLPTVSGGLLNGTGRGPNNEMPPKVNK